MALPTVFTPGDVFTAANANLLRSNQFNLTTSTKTVSYVLVAADVGTRVLMNAAGSTTITANSSLFAAGDTLEISNIGAGVCTITSGTCTVTSSAPLALVQYASGTLFFTSASAAIFIASAGSGGKIAQVVQATFATSTASTSSSFVTSGLNASITPTLNTSKVLVMVTMPARTENTSGSIICGLFRGTVAGTNLTTAQGFGRVNGGNDLMAGTSINYLDSPATTSATTYTVGFKSTSGQNAVCQVGDTTSSITLIEVLA